MSNPQQPEPPGADDDGGLGNQQGPGEGGGTTGPNPLDNESQEERRSDEPSAAR